MTRTHAGELYEFTCSVRHTSTREPTVRSLIRMARGSRSDAKRSWVRLCVLALLVLNYSQCEAQSGAEVLVPEVSVAALSGKLKASDLPRNAAARPPRPSSGSWGFCNNLRRLQCVDTEAVDVDTNDQGVGALRITIKHKLLPGITPDMMLWLFENLEKTFPYTIGNKTYSHSLYLRMHPVDHVYFAARTVNGKRQGDFIETPLIGCTQPAKLNTAVPYNCPDTRQGLVRTPAPTTLDVFQTKLTQYVSQMNADGYGTYTEVTDEKLQQLGTDTWNVSSLEHQWEVKGNDLNVTTTLLIGLMKLGTSNELYNTSTYVAQIANRGIITNYNKTAQWKDKSVKWLGYASAMHFVQEIQYLPKWLPDAYSRNAA